MGFIVNWLDTPGGVYWISGKPGSGKSTLMKYLYNNLRLSHSKSAAHQILLSFWFWEAADKELQRNFQGCLQSLLWQLLQDKVFGDGLALGIGTGAYFVWTIPMLYDAFKAALSQLQVKNISVLICLDGLDESGRDGEALIRFAQDITKSFSHVKVCVSSRPERLFETQLARYPKLRTQDLNSQDVDAIIQQRLLECEDYIALCQSDPAIRDMYLPQLIRWKAQGILLWVRLAISDLLRGIRNLDTKQELEERVNNMPEELDGLYNFMLKRNSNDAKHYWGDAAFYCQLASHREMNLVQFCLAINDEARRAYLRLQEGWEILHHKLACERAKVWISVRTAGLLEVNTRHTRNPKRCSRTRSPSLTYLLDTYQSQAVQFIHRTARTYVLGSSAGRALLKSSSRSAKDISQLCLETRLTADLVLPALESVAPVGIAGFDLGFYGCGNCTSEHSSEAAKYTETVLDQLLSKALLWCDPDPPFPHFDVALCHRPFPGGKDLTLDYCKLYLMPEEPDWGLVSETLPKQAKGLPTRYVASIMPDLVLGFFFTAWAGC